MASMRVLGADRLVTLIEVERGAPVTAIDLGFLLYGGADLSADVARDLMREMQRRNKDGR